MKELCKVNIHTQGYISIDEQYRAGLAIFMVIEKGERKYVT